MALDLFALGLKIESKGLVDAKQGLAGIDAQGKALQNRFNLLKATIVGTAIVGFATKLVRESIEAQKVMAQLEAAVKSTGGAAGLSVAELDKMAGALQRTTTYSDDAVKAAQSVLLTFTEIRGPEFRGAIQAVTDLAARMGGDLKGAALQVGKALQDPATGLTALRRSGVSFSAAQVEVIKKLQETGQAAKAQQLILAELEKQFGGSAVAARDTLGGALDGLANSWGDLFEVTADSSSGMIGAINRLSKALDDNREKWHRWAAALLDPSGGPFEALNKIIERMNVVGAWLHGGMGFGRGGGGGGGRDTPTGPLTMPGVTVMATPPVPRQGGGSGKAGEIKLPSIGDIDFEGLKTPFESQEFSGPIPDWMRDAFSGPWSVDAMKAVKEANKQIAEAAIADAKMTAKMMQEQFASIFASGIVNGLIQGFQDGGIAGAFKSLSQSLLSGLGQMFAAIAVKAIAASKLMATVTKFFVAHPLLALGAGVALLALARGMGGGGGGGAGGFAGGGAYTSGVGRGTEEATRYKFVNRDGSIVNSLKPAQPLVFNVFGNTPEVQRFIGETSAAYERRKG